MLDDLFDLFERDKKSTASSKSGLRGRLSTLLGADEDDRPSPGRDRRYSDDRHDDDDRQRSHRKRSRALFDFED